MVTIKEALERLKQQEKNGGETNALPARPDQDENDIVHGMMPILFLCGASLLLVIAYRANAKQQEYLRSLAQTRTAKGEALRKLKVGGELLTPGRYVIRGHYEVLWEGDTEFLNLVSEGIRRGLDELRRGIPGQISVEFVEGPKYCTPRNCWFLISLRVKNVQKQVLARTLDFILHSAIHRIINGRVGLGGCSTYKVPEKATRDELIRLFELKSWP